MNFMKPPLPNSIPLTGKRVKTFFMLFEQSVGEGFPRYPIALGIGCILLRVYPSHYV